MADEIEQVEVAEVPAEPATPRDRLGRFTAAVEAIEQAEAPAPEPAAEQITQPEETPADAGELAPAPVAEGPSDNMLAVARAMGVDEQLLTQAADDADVRLLMSATRLQTPRSEQDRPAQERVDPTPDPEFAFEWPDEEIPATDPIRRQLERMHEHYRERDKKREAELDELTTWAVTKGRIEQQREEVKRMTDYDTALDAAKIPAFGESAKLRKGVSPEWHARNEHYLAYRTMTDQLGFTPDQAVAAIATKVGHKASQPSVAQVVRQQAQTRLGGGAPRPAPAAPLSREQKWAEKMAALEQ